MLHVFKLRFCKNSALIISAISPICSDAIGNKILALTFVSAAHALARRVFPVPGGPYSKTPTKLKWFIKFTFE